ncbi:hypothetical protein DY000_02029276 [Brassica cretica]|uniref:Uncharacterized protein n=1 Tax=Brassica cretica TaxID=69181 RepID=A0ABQ7DFF2_BRACR|nr:hypothetical protein DY000_02029276 [Brassica cretica]
MGYEKRDLRSMTPRGHHHHSRLLTARRERKRRGEEQEREEGRSEERERGERRRRRERKSRRLGLPVFGNFLQGFASKLSDGSLRGGGFVFIGKAKKP